MKGLSLIPLAQIHACWKEKERRSLRTLEPDPYGRVLLSFTLDKARPIGRNFLVRM